MTVEHADLEERLAKALKAAAASIPHDEPPVEWVDVVRRRPPAPVRRDRPHSRGRVWIISAVAGVIVLGAVVTVAIALAPTSHNRTTFASRLLTAAPQKGSAPRSSAGDWTLLGYVSDATWRVNPQGPSSGSIACPNSTTCYVVSGISTLTSDAAPIAGTVLNVSKNSGASWARYRMPSGLGLTSPLSCPTHDDLDCLAGGTHGAGPALLSTSDGGATWSARSLPATDGSPIELSCVSMMQLCGPLSDPCRPALVRGEGDRVERHLCRRHPQRKDLFDDRWRPDVEAGALADRRRSTISELCSWSVCRHGGNSGADCDRRRHERGGVHQRRSRRDLAGRQTPAGLRSCLERTHTSRLRDVLDVLGHGNRCGAARRVFAPQLLDQCCCVVRRWRVDMGGSSAAVRRGKSAPLFDQLPSTRRLLVGRLEQRLDHRPKLTLERHPLHSRRR